MKNKEQTTPEKKYRFKWIIMLVFLLLIGYGTYRLIAFYYAPNRTTQQIYLIPKDAIFIIHSNNPVNDWKRFSQSEPWQCLKQSPSFADFGRNADMIDSVLHANKKVMTLIGERDLMISAHRTRPGKLDFLYVLDLRKLSEVTILKEQIDKIYSLMNYQVTYRRFQDADIIELRNPKTRDMLYTAFADNHFIASASSKLVETAISERHNPVIGLDPLFNETDRLVEGKGNCRIFVQHAFLPYLMDMHKEKNNRFLPAIGESTAYTGFDLFSEKDRLELQGYVLLKDTVTPYVSTLLQSDAGELTAYKILSDRTAFYTALCMDDMLSFVDKMETTLHDQDPSLYGTYKTSYDKIESMFDISLREDFLSWMAGELAVTELEPGLLGHDPEIVLAVRTKDLGEAQKKMEHIEKQVKKNTPVYIKKVNYKGYEINYIELKGFFTLFFGKMFNKFEKPYYTYINDFVVFSNKPATLLSFIEDYEQERTLRNDVGFKEILSKMNNRASYFIYMNSIKFFPLMEPILKPKTWESFSENRKIVYSFPYSALQITGDRRRVAIQMIMSHHPYQEFEPTDETELDDDNDTEYSETAIINELNRFYAEKFQGNIYREFYPEGMLKSECEIHEGLRNGKYHEYHRNGNLKIRGKYKKNNPTGTWKYYTEDGKLDRKEIM